MDVLLHPIRAAAGVWLLPILIAITLVCADRRRARAEARALVEWQDELWRRWQTGVARHAQHYDRYWAEICSAWVRVYTERPGDADLQALVRGAVAKGVAASTIAHGLAANYAANPDFVRRYGGFADRATHTHTSGSNHGR